MCLFCGVTRLSYRSTACNSPEMLRLDVQVGMLFVRCEGGISHSPAENVLEDDIGAASMALYEFLNADITEVEHSKS